MPYISHGLRLRFRPHHEVRQKHTPSRSLSPRHPSLQILAPPFGTHRDHHVTVFHAAIPIFVLGLGNASPQRTNATCLCSFETSSPLLFFPMTKRQLLAPPTGHTCIYSRFHLMYFAAARPSHPLDSRSLRSCFPEAHPGTATSLSGLPQPQNLFL